jgi:hypothetical protein
VLTPARIPELREILAHNRDEEKEHAGNGAGMDSAPRSVLLDGAEGSDCSATGPIGHHDDHDH